MEMFGKLIFLIILINLVMLNSCEKDDLYKNFEAEQEKFINMLEKSYIKNNVNNNDEIPIKSAIVEDDDDEVGGGGSEAGSEKQDENFRLLFNHVRAYRDKNRLMESNDGKNKSKKEKKN